MKTTTKNQVLDTLQWSQEQYEQRLFTSIWNWCHLHGMYPSVIQQLLANAKINQWFMREHDKLEQQFLNIANVVPNKTEALQAHYKACTAQIMAIYPKPLIKLLHKNKEFSNLLITNTPIYFAN